MKFKSVTKSISLLTMASLLSAGLAAAEAVASKQLALERESVRLIGQMEEVARDIHYNADRLNSLTVPARTTKVEPQPSSDSDQGTGEPRAETGTGGQHQLGHPHPQ